MDPFVHHPTPPLRPPPVPRGVAAGAEGAGLQRDRIDVPRDDTAFSDSSSFADEANTAYQLLYDTPTLQIAIDGTSIVRVLNKVTGNYAQITSAGDILVYNDANGAEARISPVGLVDNIAIDKAGVKVTHTATGDYARMSNAGTITVYNAGAGKTLTLAPSAITQNMSPVEIDVCDSGTAKKMLILGSVTY